jgi:hypothetical protein
MTDVEDMPEEREKEGLQIADSNVAVMANTETQVGSILPRNSPRDLPPLFFQIIEKGRYLGFFLSHSHRMLRSLNVMILPGFISSPQYGHFVTGHFLWCVMISGGHLPTK